jgi:hypothetical protein
MEASTRALPLRFPSRTVVFPGVKCADCEGWERLSGDPRSSLWRVMVGTASLSLIGEEGSYKRLAIMIEWRRGRRRCTRRRAYPSYKRKEAYTEERCSNLATRQYIACSIVPAALDSSNQIEIELGISTLIPAAHHAQWPSICTVYLTRGDSQDRPRPQQLRPNMQRP